MKWGECKLAALQTMFANEGSTIHEDDSNQEYIYAMPAKANEALHQLASIGRPIRKQFRIQVLSGAETSVTEDLLILPASDVLYKLKMTDYCPRWRCMERSHIYLDDGNTYAAAQNWHLEGDDVLVLPGNQEGEYTVWYNAYPQTITNETPDEDELDIAAEAAVLIPLYIAAELYKEDELSLATVFRNEFEDGLSKLRQSYSDSGGGFVSGEVRNTTGWW